MTPTTSATTVTAREPTETSDRDRPPDSERLRAAAVLAIGAGS